MSIPKRLIVILFIFPLMLLGNMLKSSAADGGSDFSIGTLSYLAYQTQIDKDGITNGSFRINRSYLTVKKSLFKNLGFRITVDAHQDETGDMKARLKYVYAHFVFDEFLFITKPNIEFGLVHTPWLDFEEYLNYYRMQGTMFMERSGLYNSSDFGITVGGLLGGELDDNYKKTVNSKYAGRYGSFALGIYNGGGYHAIESNENKTFQGRLTLRPLPDIIPGLQVSYFGTFGKSNLKNDTIPDFESPDWNTNAAMLSYEDRCLTLTGQYVFGKGNQKGNLSDTDFNATDIGGFSFFAEGKLDENWRIIGRFESFDPNKEIDDNEENRAILGVGYDFGHHNVLILDFDKVWKKGKEDVNLLKLTMQVEF